MKGRLLIFVIIIIMTSESPSRSILFLCLITGMLVISSFMSGQTMPKSQILENGNIRANISARGITSLTSPGDKFQADIINSRSPWGRVKLVYKSGNDDWKEIQDTVMNIKSMSPSSVVLTSAATSSSVDISQGFTLNGKGLDYDITISCGGNSPIEIGDLAISLPWRRASGENGEYIFEKCFTKHHYISGNGSFIVNSTRLSANQTPWSVLLR